MFAHTTLGWFHQVYGHNSHCHHYNNVYNYIATAVTLLIMSPVTDKLPTEGLTGVEPRVAQFHKGTETKTCSIHS